MSNWDHKLSVPKINGDFIFWNMLFFLAFIFQYMVLSACFLSSLTFHNRVYHGILSHLSLIYANISSLPGLLPGLLQNCLHWSFLFHVAFTLQHFQFHRAAWLILFFWIGHFFLLLFFLSLLISLLCNSFQLWYQNFLHRICFKKKILSEFIFYYNLLWINSMAS